MKIYFVCLAVLAVVGVGLLIASRQPDSDEAAGVAYIETEDGQLVESTGQRSAEKIAPPQRADGSDEEWLTKFVLTERSGKPFGSADLRGTPYVAGFFFSMCPSICTRQNAKVKELQDQFAGEPVRFLSISCDPEVDQPEVLAEYAKRYDADAEQWLFLTGKMTYIRRVGSEIFSLGVERRGHPEKFALMDANGEMFGLYTWSDDGQWDALEGDIEKLIAAGGVIKKEDTADTEQTADEDSTKVSSK